MAHKDAKIGSYDVTVAPDLPDIRDWPYRPALIQLKSRIDPPRNLVILDQKSEGACTGFGLAAVINYLNQMRGRHELRVSARMLYEMARKNDEWEGEDYSGSSLRGAIKGWHHMGVCEDRLWKYQAGRRGSLSVDAAKNARAQTVGAYYRIEQTISDMHAALNEAGAVYCSARVHSGWEKDNIEAGVIPLREETQGGHAFAVVGYDEKGFWVQNSWGHTWGDDGLAIWQYEDWQANAMDAWVLRLALSTPQIWHLRGTTSRSLTEQTEKRPDPSRSEIAGHFVHIDDGDFHDKGRYWSTRDDVKKTADLLAGSDGYDHLLLYAHGGLNTPVDSARRVRGMRDVFKANRIYPYHFMYDTGILEELKDIIVRRGRRARVRAEGITDASDWLIEKLTRIPGRALWREMKRGARLPFNRSRAGSKALELMLGAVQESNRLRQAGDGPLSGKPAMQIHIVGHSTGAILLGHLLNRMADFKPALRPRVTSASLFAPAASVDFFKDRYVPYIKAATSRFGIDQTRIYNLSEKLEQDDSVGPYRKSLLYLVSRAFEEDRPEPLLGMEKYGHKLPDLATLTVIRSQGDTSKEERTSSKDHGGFDNDLATMNHLLKVVTNGNVARPFKAHELKY